MGLSSSKAKSSYTPSPQQLGAANTLTGAYSAAQPRIQAVSDMLYGQVPGVASTLSGTTANVNAASGYYGDVLGGRYLGEGNPYIARIAEDTADQVTDQVNGSFSAAGRTGSGANTYALTKALASARNGLFASQYDAERSRMDSAAAGAGALNGQTIGSLLSLGTTAAGFPLTQAQQYAAGIGGLGISGTRTETSSPSAAQQIGQALQLGSMIFSDRRLKTEVTCTGVEPDGLGRYSYRYIWGGPLVEGGVMADEVAALRPWALGPRVGGFATVNMGAL